MECVICLEDTGRALLIGCDHIYCQSCIGEWCIRKEALCPVCQSPIYGFSGLPANLFFLSLHSCPDWGMSLAPQTFLDHETVVLVKSVRERSICHVHGLRDNDLIRVFGANQKPLKGISTIIDFARQAHRGNRMLKVERLGSIKNFEKTMKCMDILKRRFGA